jgi:hypothetical protein
MFGVMGSIAESRPVLMVVPQVDRPRDVVRSALSDGGPGGTVRTAL